MLKTSSDGQGGQGVQSALTSFEKKLVGRDPDDSAIPVSVRRSVRLMLAGGALTAALGIFWIIVALADKSAFTSANGQKLTNGQFAGGVVEVFLLQYLIPAAIWVLMARFNRAGRNWARIVASVLCALDTYLCIGLVNSLRDGQTLTVAEVVAVALTLMSWIVGVIAIAFIFRGESSGYFRERGAQRQP